MANSAPGRLDEQAEKAKKFLISLKYVAQMAGPTGKNCSGGAIQGGASQREGQFRPWKIG